MDPKRTDSVASQMGKMLLQGYRMLATSCEICNNVLMQDKHGKNICINCDDNEKEARMAAALMGGDAQRNPEGGRVNNATFEPDLINVAHSRRVQASKLVQSEDISSGKLYRILSANQRVLMEQMKVAGQTLDCDCNMDIQQKLLHVKYIRDCAEAIACIQKLDC